jgi:DNA polymerase III epsilon subunit family exonuclease
MGEDNNFLVLDIETTGLSAYMHKITEISALKMENGRIIDEFTTLINPQTRIPSFITRLTGIDNEMVKDAPKIRQIMPGFVEFLEDYTLVGHNATFDYKFLNHNAITHAGKPIENPVLCTCKLARRLLPQLPSKRLAALCEHFQIRNEQSHRARGDALATSQILQNFLNTLEKRGITKHEEILAFQKSKIPKIY